MLETFTMNDLLVEKFVSEYTRHYKVKGRIEESAYNQDKKWRGTKRRGKEIKIKVTTRRYNK